MDEKHEGHDAMLVHLANYGIRNVQRSACLRLRDVVEDWAGGRSKDEEMETDDGRWPPLDRLKEEERPSLVNSREAPNNCVSSSEPVRVRGGARWAELAPTLVPSL